MFVTHDIGEAIKMGTRVCILHVGGIIAQYGPPDEILSNPTSDFVADFVGADRGLKRLNLVRAEADAIVTALRASNGRLTDTARLLGISRTTLWRKMKKHGINTGGRREEPGSMFQL